MVLATQSKLTMGRSKKGGVKQKMDTANPQINLARANCSSAVLGRVNPSESALRRSSRRARKGCDGPSSEWKQTEHMKLMMLKPLVLKHFRK